MKNLYRDKEYGQNPIPMVSQRLMHFRIVE